jgi:hypothetical protein
MRFIVSVVIFAVMVSIATVFGLVAVGDIELQHVAASSKGPWLAGVITGILIAWIARIPWTELPLRAAYWAKVQGRRIWWMAVGVVCISVIMVY